MDFILALCLLFQELSVLQHRFHVVPPFSLFFSHTLKKHYPKKKGSVRYIHSSF